MKSLIAILFLTLFTFAAHAEYRASIGSGLLIENLEIEGAELNVIPRIDPKIPIILRIVETETTENGYSYDLHVEGLDEGTYNIANYLKRADGSDTAIPEIPFEVYSILKDKWAEPNSLEIVKPEEIGGYRRLIWTLCILWIVGLTALLVIRKKRALTTQVISEPTLSERIHTLLQGANGDLTAEEKAELDRMIIGHWRHQFPDLEHRPVADSIAFLKTNEESASMMHSIEKWLHSGREVSEKEINHVLDKYQFSNKEGSIT